MGGRGPLPFSGGAAEQPALIMDAFGTCATAYALMNPVKEDD